MRNRIIGSVLLVLTLITAGCATLSPGQDPLVVRVEQAENIGFGTVQTFLQIDDFNRTGPQLNFGQAHAFAEHLREKVIVDGQTNRLYVSVFKTLDKAKLVYIADHGQSNQVFSALAAVDVLLGQSQQYITQLNAK